MATVRLHIRLDKNIKAKANIFDELMVACDKSQAAKWRLVR